jgi:hypothetical protein
MPDQTTPPNPPDSKPDIDREFKRGLLVEEVKHRRDKEWKIFSYATSVLLAIITAIVAISARPGFTNFGIRQKVILLATMLVLTAAAGWWLYRNLFTERRILKQLVDGDYKIEPLARWNRTTLLTGYLTALCLIFVITVWAIIWLYGSQSPPTTDGAIKSENVSWYFAVSGDSRDCGDLIMPKIAQTIAHNKQNEPVDFYWHLGDLRALYRFDCDMMKSKDPSFQCPPEIFAANKTDAKKEEYLANAWPDYINSQIAPFEKINLPFYLGIGNHELVAPRTRDDFRNQFKKWLTQPTIQTQRASNRANGIASKDGDTYFHFLWKGVDIIYLDNASIYDDQDPKRPKDPGFSDEELTWLDLVLNRDEANPQIKTIIVGMHAALPESISKKHAMDRNCPAFCAGKKAYDRLAAAQSRGKKVYVMASHSHYFEEYIYDTPEHGGHGLPGWIIGTAGAEQYRADILYGYLLVEVTPDGAIHNSFKAVYRDTPPEGSPDLTRFCFEQNRRAFERKEDFFTGATCPCPTKF